MGEVKELLSRRCREGWYWRSCEERGRVGILSGLKGKCLVRKALAR